MCKFTGRFFCVYFSLLEKKDSIEVNETSQELYVV